MEYKKVRELVPPLFPSDKFTIEEAMAAVEKVQAEENARRASGRKRARPAAPVPASRPQEEGSPPLRMRTLQPPHPGTSFTIEEAMAALIKVEAEEKARRASKRKRARSAAKPEPESKKTDDGKGDDGS